MCLQFTVQINNKKEKTNNIVEVIIRGEPGAYVGLSGVDAAFYTMQAGNDISYAEVLTISHYFYSVEKFHT